MIGRNKILMQRWLTLGRKLAVAGLIGPVGQELLTRYSEPHRHYHNCDHLVDCFDILDSHAAEAEDSCAVELALWFHDAVYRVGASDNEELSAALARKSLGSLGLPKPRMEAVSAAIMATRHKGEPGASDARLVCDIDLSILGSSELRYRAYAEAIFAESGMRVEVFRPLRIRFLEAMLGRQHVFHTTRFRCTLEEAAHRNMVREKDELSQHA